MKKHIYYLLVIILFFISGNLLLSQDISDNSEAHFGTGIAFITPKTEEGDFEPISYLTISPLGNYVAGASFTNSNDVVIHIWDTSLIDTSGEMTTPDPTYSIQLDNTYGEPLSLSTHLLFSSQEQYLAVQSHNDLFIFQLPEFHLQYRRLLPISISWDGQWIDDNILIFSDASRVVAIDIATQDRYPKLMNSTTYIYNLNGYWLFDIVRNNEISFQVCTQLLDECQTYKNAGPPEAVHSSGLVITWGSRSRSETWFSPTLWRCADITCEQDVTYFSELDGKFLPVSFSPSGEYLIGQNLETPLDEVRDFDTLELIQTYQAYHEPDWLDDTYFVAYAPPLRLYRVGQEEPLDEISQLELRQFADERGLVISEVNRSRIPIANNQWVLRDWGMSAMLIPIIYEEGE